MILGPDQRHSGQITGITSLGSGDRIRKKRCFFNEYFLSLAIVYNYVCTCQQMILRFICISVFTPSITCNLPILNIILITFNEYRFLFMEIWHLFRTNSSSIIIE